jgi:hypothetical protein
MPVVTSTLLTTTTVSVLEEQSSAELRAEVALAVATDPEAVRSLSPGEAEEVFSAIQESALTIEEGIALVAAVQGAPPAIRKSFEKKVNVFGGKTDTYIPLSSRIPVSERRTLIAATGLATVIPPPTSKRKK